MTEADLRCRVASAGVGEPTVGTAPHAVGWLVLEQPGPWGRTAWTSSRLDPALGARVEAACAGSSRPVRPVLVRRPDGSTPADRTLLLAHTVPSATWLVSAQVPPDGLATLPWEDLAEAAAAGDLEAARRALPGATEVPPVLLVCTNGKRDRCCAIDGRPVAMAADAAHPGRCWETTHLGGHRFAPTAVVLPAGTMHGRLDATAVGTLLGAADRGEVRLDGWRGRSTWAPPAQAAEHAVRLATGEHAADALDAETDAGVEGGPVTVRHRDGRTWTVDVHRSETGAVRPESCGKEALPVVTWTAEAPRPAAPVRPRGDAR